MASSDHESSADPDAPIAPAQDSLSTYRAKRSPDRSPEPVGTVSPVPGRLFVIHKHAARQLHYDLRLEMDGVLRSWAVPRGPSYDQKDKRLAVRVEDHPLEYGDFEGIIPAGNYGAGGVIVWDRGEWIPLEDWREGLAKGKLLFEFNGYKLHGKWTLVKIKKSDKDWLLIKERDAWMKSPGDQFDERSVLSGLTVAEVKEGKSPALTLRKAIEAAGAPQQHVDVRSVSVMLAEPDDKAFTNADWLFELKLDGYRMLASKRHGESLLLSRNGNDYTAVFPEVARAIKALPFEEIILDGEIVCLDPEGRPQFSRLQQRSGLSSSVDVKRAAVELPATYYVFDFLAFEDYDLRPLPLAARKTLLTEGIPKLGAVRPLDHIEGEGEAFLNQVRAMGLEGIIAKRANAPYKGGRSDQWLKIKAEPTGDFVIVGFTEAKGNRSGFGALQLADLVNGSLVYAGRVGTGFNDSLLSDLSSQLDGIIRSEPPCAPPIGAGATAIPETKTTTWVDPIYVCEVRFREWTPDGILRHSAFLRMRPDKHPADCVRQRQPGRNALPPQPPAISEAEHAVLSSPSVEGEPNAANAAAEPVSGDAVPREPEQIPQSSAPRTAEKSFNFSNLKKIYWPAEKYTKGDMIEYYRGIAPWMLPYLRNRPLVMTRFPDGIDGKSFYQKDSPEFAPSWIGSVEIWSEDTQRDIRYFVCNDVESLLYIANLGSIPIHIWNSRVGSLELPDWCVIDLDPKEAPFSDVVRTALVLHELCEAIGLPNYVKTTGKTGLHILLPLGRQCTYAQSRTLGELLARVVLRDLGDIATITRVINKRGDKVYFDYLQNRHGQLIVAPYSVRPLPGATVSMPLTWDEVDQSLDPKMFTIKNAVDRLERLGKDPCVQVLEDKPDLAAMLERLAGKLNG